VSSPHEASQSDHGGGRGTDNCASNMNQGGGDGIGLCDGSVAVNDRPRKVHAAERIESIPLNTEMTPESHGKSNSSEIEVIILRTLIG